MGEDIAALLGRAAATPPRSSHRPAAPWQDDAAINEAIGAAAAAAVSRLRA